AGRARLPGRPGPNGLRTGTGIYRDLKGSPCGVLGIWDGKDYRRLGQLNVERSRRLRCLMPRHETRDPLGAVAFDRIPVEPLMNPTGERLLKTTAASLMAA